MPDFKYAGQWNPGVLAFETSEGNLTPAGEATLTVETSDSDAAVFYTDRTKAETTDPDLTTNANGNLDDLPLFLDPGSYAYEVMDAQGNSHGPYFFVVNPDVEEPTVTFVDYTLVSETLVGGEPWQNPTSGSVVVAVPVTYTPTGGAAATLHVALSPTTEGSEGALEASFPISGPVVTLVHRIIVPPAWFLRLDAVQATIAAGTYQPVAA